MKYLFVASFMLVWATAFAAASDPPRVEVSGGYSLLHINNEGSGSNLHGWDVSVAGNVNSWFGLVADFSGHNRSIGVTLPGLGNFTADGNVHLFLFGPRFKLRSGRLEPFGHVLFGAARGKGSLGLGPAVNASATDTAAAFAAGAGLDLRAGDHFAIRLFQGDYLYTLFNDDVQNNARFSFGVVFRFGEVH